MQQILYLSPVLLLLAYTFVAGAYGLLFFTGNNAARRIGPIGLRAAVLLHLAQLVGLTWRWMQLPAATVSQALSLVAFAIALIYTLLEWHGREQATGFWLTSQVWLFQVLAVISAGPIPVQRELFEQPLFGIHVFFALLGYASFAVAATYGFLFLMLYRELKRGRFNVFYGKLPPLEVLERMMVGALVVGLVSLTAALLNGVAWASQLGKSDLATDPLILLSVATWGLYVLALALRRLHQWHGRQTALASITGLSMILVSLLAIRLFRDGFHGGL